MSRQAIFLNPLFTNQFDWYVDSVNGNDANAGKSPGTAFATIAAMEAVAGNGDTIGLACGSTWLEEIDLTIANATIKAYGAGAAPLLDAGALISGTWDSSVERVDANTNVYSISIAPEPGVAGQNWINAWEDGAYLLRAADLATCQATAGTLWVADDDATPADLYVHPFGSTNPNTDSKSYHYSKRYNGCNLVGDGNTLEGIRARRNLGSNGTIRLYGINQKIRNCTAQQAGKHALQIGSGTVQNCTVADAYINSVGGNLVLHYLGAGAAEALPVNFIDVDVSQDAVLPAASGFFGHTADANYGDITFTRCTTNSNVTYSYSPTDVTGTVTFIDCTLFTGTAVAAIQRNSAYDLVVSGGTITGPFSHIRTTTAGAWSCTLTNVAFILNGGSANSLVSTQQIALTVTDCTFQLDGAAGTLKWIGPSHASSTVTITGCSFEDVTRTYEFTGGLASLSSNNNCFEGDANEFRYLADTMNFAAWQALGHDAASTQGTCF